MGDTAGSPREARRGTAWMRCVWWAVCRRCGERLEVGEWQGLVDVPGRGRWWVHETCALELGATAREPDDSAPPAPAAAGPVRIVVIGSAVWPRDRAVEVRDGIEAVARGHREVVIVHSARRDRTGRLCGVDAWAALTAQRLGYPAEPHHTSSNNGARTVDELRKLRPSVVVAFPLEQRPDAPGDVAGGAGHGSARDPVETLAAAAELAGMPVLVHRPAAASDQLR